MADRVRVGVIVSGDKVPAWAYTALDRVRQLNYVEIVVIARQGAGQPPTPGWGTLLVHKYRTFENHRFRYKPDAFELKPLSSLLPDVPIVDAYAASDYRPDLWLALGSQNDIPAGSARYGLWTFEHGGIDAGSNLLDGLRELLTQRYIVESTLRITSSDDHNGLILARTISAVDRLPINRSRNAYYWKSASLLPRALKALHDQGADHFLAQIRAASTAPHPEKDARRTEKPLSNGEFLFYFARYLAGTLPKYLYRALTFKQWLLLYDFSENVIPHSYNTFKKIIPPPDRLWADPQVICHDGQYYVFLEEKLHTSNTGHISVLVMDKNGNHSPPVTVLERDYHLSYPFVFEWQGNWFMIPETNEHRTIEVYRCAEFPYRWEYAITLMENCTAYDATLFHYSGKWWLFTSIQETPGASPWGDELFLFHADSPLSRQWQPHPRNPIVSDVRSARPAGPLFEHNGQIYRPSQDSAEGYGRRLKFNRVLVLSETEYSEEEAHTLTPDSSLDGIHSFSRAQGLTMLDMRTRWFRWKR